MTCHVKLFHCKTDIEPLLISMMLGTSFAQTQAPKTDAATKGKVFTGVSHSLHYQDSRYKH